ncbi:MAG: hypothetical protein OXN21_07675 [Chloroflexota bacterium]|nr:hypothetical protein [Chloroflexota bacterium]
MNMGTREHPAGLSHWSNVAMFANKLENFRKRQKGFWLLFRECCGQCEAGGFFENILTDVTAVRREYPAGNYQPDLTLERGDKPPVWLEFTDASPPSIQKLAYCAAHGIDIFQLDGGQRPADSSVFKAHIAPRNCRQKRRQRFHDIWEHLRKLPSEKQVIGIREDFRSPQRKTREFEEFWNEAEDRRQAVAAGEVRCARCDKSFGLSDGGYSISYLSTHRQGGGCAEVPFCNECSFAIMGGWDGVFPDDAPIWGQLNEDCPECQGVMEQMREMDEAPQLRHVEMPEPYGRWVWEPEKRVQSFIVGDRSIAKSEFLAVVMTFRYLAHCVWELSLSEGRPFPVDLGVLLEQLDEMESAVLYPNNIIAWDWREGVGDTYVSDHEARGNHKGDRFFPVGGLSAEPLPSLSSILNL